MEKGLCIGVVGRGAEGRKAERTRDIFFLNGRW